jgi:hypothetical protein
VAEMAVTSWIPRQDAFSLTPFKAQKDFARFLNIRDNCKGGVDLYHEHQAKRIARVAQRGEEKKKKKKKKKSLPVVLDLI